MSGYWLLGPLSALFLAVSPSLCLGESIVIDNTDSGFFSGRGVGVPLLKYHGLSPDCGDPAFSPKVFREQMQWLRDNSFVTISMGQLVDWIRTGKPALPARPCIVVFDDNYLSVYTVAFPTMREFGQIGYNCTPTKYVGIKTQWPHPTWDNLCEMEEAGVIFTESHTVSHPILTSLSDADIEMEVRESKATIERHMPGKTCRYFASASASWDDRVTSAAHAAGYEAAMIGREKLLTRDTDLFEISRFLVSPMTTFTMEMFRERAEAGLGQGAWETVTTAGKTIGKDCVAIAAGDGTACASWQWTPKKSGRYTVLAHIPEGATATATDATYAVRTRDGISTATVNQAATENAGHWVQLGEYEFKAGRPAYIALNNCANGTVVADAVKIESIAATSAD